jgi:hypothetical protein
VADNLVHTRAYRAREVVAASRSKVNLARKLTARIEGEKAENAEQRKKALVKGGGVRVPLDALLVDDGVDLESCNAWSEGGGGDIEDFSGKLRGRTGKCRKAGR